MFYQTYRHILPRNIISLDILNHNIHARKQNCVSLLLEAMGTPSMWQLLTQMSAHQRRESLLEANPVQARPAGPSAVAHIS